MAAGGDRRRARIGRWLCGPDGRAVSLLVVVPLLCFVVPALAGHPAVTGDNLIQNFPLRALAGRQIDQGHLPLWNPYIWSGSPLLGGLNAGALYPLTLAFAVLPAMAAWVLGVAAVYWAGGLGLYALARTYRLGPLASLVGALVYAYGGAMAGQTIHLGVVQGIGWMPLLILAELRLSWAVLGTGPVRGPGAGPASEPAGGEPPLRRGGGLPAHWRRSSPWPWAALLAACIGLEALTGEPRAMAETEVVAVVVAAWLVARPYAGAVSRRLRAAYVGWAVLAGVWGVALAAVELAPGWSFIRASQRASETYGFFGSGSLRPTWSVLLFVPDMIGGAGLWGQPRWLSSYNLAEVTGYMGILALVAVAALVTRTFGRRRAALSSDWAMWLGLAVLGLLLAFGSFTFLGHIWSAIPLYGKTRLQSRSLAIVDLGLAMLLAFWADRALRGRLADAGMAGWRRYVASVPLVIAAVLCVAVVAFPVGTEEFLGASPTGGADARELWPWMVAQLVVVAGATAVVWGWGRLRPRLRRGALLAVVMVDLVVFVVATSSLVVSSVPDLEPTGAQAAAVLGTTGRFAVYDTTSARINTLATIGQPDLNAFTRLGSVQGYGSILSQGYGTATGSHTLDALTPCALARGVFTQLRLATLLTLPQFLAPTAPATGPPLPAPSCPGAPGPGTASSRTLYLGRAAAVRSAYLAADFSFPVGGTYPATFALRLHLRVGVLRADGAVAFPSDTVRWTGHGWNVRFTTPVGAVGLVLRGDAGAVLDTSTVTGTAAGTPGVGHWAFDGVLQNALGQRGWRYSGTWELYAKFTAVSVRPPVWIAGGGEPSSPCSSSSGCTARLPTATVRQVSTTDWGTEVDRVTARRAVTVVRSEAWLTGWKAELAPVGGGPARTLGVSRHGLVQAVRVPPGRWTLTFVYRAPHLTVGLVASGAALAGFVVLGAGWLVRRRRRGWGRGRAGSGPRRPVRLLGRW